MKRFIIFLTVGILLPCLSRAQDLNDALRYSEFYLQGTARAGGMGNAFGALGGDFTSLSINPAGLGIYLSDEFTLSPSFGQIQADANYMGNVMSDSKYHFALNNLSYVTSLKTKNSSETGLVNVNIGIGFNRLKDYNSTMLAGARNLNGSFLDYLAANATANIWSEYYEELAWETDLLLFDEEANLYWHDMEEAGYGQSQRKSISKSGAINEYSFAAGLNFNHRLYIGASLGIVDVDYEESTELLEYDEDNSIPFFNEMQFDTYLHTTGTGYNGKLGIIYKPINEIRLGASVHTPTFYNLNDFFETSMFSSVTYEEGDTENYEEDSPISEFDYDLESPLRAIVSAAFVFPEKGLISVDYEYVDYSSASLRRGGDGYGFVDENSEITEVFQPVGNLRAGGELLATENIALRAGFEHYPSAYAAEAFGSSQPNADAARNVYSAGLGYRMGGFFFDVAYRQSRQNFYELVYPQPIDDYYVSPEMASFDKAIHKVLFTLGFKF